MKNLPYYSQILSFYANPKRDYHGKKQLEYQFNLIDTLIPLLPDTIEKDYATAFLKNTSLFHDCYFDYNNSKGTNERISAELAFVHIRKIDEVLAKDVRLAVLASQYLEKYPQIELSKKSSVPKLLLLFQDIDFHILQSKDYEPSIIQELLNFGYKKEQIVIGRKKFFQSLQPRIESGFFSHTIRYY